MRYLICLIPVFSPASPDRLYDIYGNVYEGEFQELSAEGVIFQFDEAKDPEVIPAKYVLKVTDDSGNLLFMNTELEKKSIRRQHKIARLGFTLLFVYCVLTLFALGSIPWPT